MELNKRNTLEQEEALNTPPKCFVCVVFLFSLK